MFVKRVRLEAIVTCLLELEEGFFIACEFEENLLVIGAGADDGEGGDVYFGEGTVEEIFLAGDAVGEGHVATAATVGAGEDGIEEAAHALEDFFLLAAVGAGEVGDEFEAKFERDVIVIELLAGVIKGLGEGGGGGTGGGEFDDGVEHGVAHTPFFDGVFGGVDIVGEAVDHHRFTGLDFHIMNQFERFLGLEGGHDGGAGGGSGYFALENVLAGEKGAGVAEIDNLVVEVGEGAFVAGALIGPEDADDAHQFLNGAIDPWFVNGPAEAIEGEAGFAVIETADNDIDVAEDAEAEFEVDVAVPRHDIDIRVEFFDAFGGGIDFAAAAVAGAEENGTAEIAIFDGVEVGDDDIAEAHEGEVFENFVAEGAGADDKSGSVADNFLLPPADVAKSVVTIGIGIGDDDGHDCSLGFMWNVFYVVNSR